MTFDNRKHDIRMLAVHCSSCAKELTLVGTNENSCFHCDLDKYFFNNTQVRGPIMVEFENDEPNVIRFVNTNSGNDQ